MDHQQEYSIPVPDPDDTSYGSGKHDDKNRFLLQSGVMGNRNLKHLSKGECSKDKDERLYTMQEAIDHLGFKWFQIRLSLITGFAWMTEALEMMMLSILGPVLHCDWYISPWEQAVLSTLVMSGMTIGSIVWGMVGDRYGRKPTLILTCTFCGYFGILTSFSPNYAWVAINRFLVGIMMGGLPLALTLYSEYLPTKTRASCLVLIEIFFSVGAALEITMAKFIVPTLGWRCLLVATALPVLILPSMTKWVPESARYLLTSGRYADAVAMLQRIARDNGSQLPPGRLKRLAAKEQRPGSFTDLFSKSRIRTCLVLNTTWFLLGFAYFGIALLAPTLFANPDGCHGNDIETTKSEKCKTNCVAFTDTDYNDLIVTSFADSPGVIFATVLMMFMGRKATIVVCLIFYALFLWLSNICLSRFMLTAFLFIPRATITGAFQTAYVYTTEVYPTKIRAFGMGMGSASARVGSVVTPYIAQVMTSYNAFISISVYAVMGMAGIVTTLLLPIETKGRPMKEESDDDETKKRTYESMQSVEY